MYKLFFAVLICTINLAVPFIAISPQWLSNPNTNLKICNVAGDQCEPEVVLPVMAVVMSPGLTAVL